MYRKGGIDITASGMTAEEKDAYSVVAVEWVSNIRKDHGKGDQTDRIACLWLKEGDYAPARIPAYVIAVLAGSNESKPLWE
jgi:hypothetical protein